VDAERLRKLEAAFRALPPEDVAAILAHAPSCAHCREELAVLAELATARHEETRAPNPALRDRVLDHARLDERRARSVRVAWAATAAAALAAIALGAWSVSLAGDRDRMRDRAAGSEQALALLAEPASTILRLEPARGRLVVAPSGEAVLVLASLEPLAGGETYEAWVVTAGREQAAGLFRSGDPVHLLTRTVDPGSFVLVTVEPEGGSATMTGPPVLRSPVRR